jgi:hypothetical protein
MLSLFYKKTNIFEKIKLSATSTTQNKDYLEEVNCHGKRRWQIMEDI